MLESLTWKIGGEAGFGIMSAGIMLARAFARHGYHIFTLNEYPSLIRGGHNAITVRMASQKFESLNRDVHILVALNKETVDLHKNELTDSSLVVFDPKDHEWQASDFSSSVHLAAIPLSELTKNLNGEPVMRNTVALGATVAFSGCDFQYLADVIRDQFKRKGEEVINLNISAAKSGYDYVKEHLGGENSFYLSKASDRGKQLVINGSEAVGVGAVRAGLKFAAIYPMTPINSLITFLADHAKQLKLVYKQPEDEIAGINMAIGASHMGVRSMVATSGGGYALMVEATALAGITETPLVIDLGMRVGPATGMPTWTEQGELQFAIHAGHGEFPRIVLAPGDAAEAYSMTIDAFNLADRYQTPVFLLTDKYLNESQWCVPIGHFQGEVLIDRGKLLGAHDVENEKEFKRYRLDVDDGASPRTVPGVKNGFFYGNSYEHDETGHVTEDAGKRTSMVDKRLRKIAAMVKEARPPTLYGEPEAEITFVTWGTTKGPVLEAMKLLAAAGKSSRLVQFTWLYPFPTVAVNALLAGTRRIIDVEQNATGQLASLIREHTGIEIKEQVLKYDGRPFMPEEIVKRI